MSSTCFFAVVILSAVLLGVANCQGGKKLSFSQKEFTADSISLAKAVNAYRKQNGLAEIPLSGSLFYVALTHTNDLQKSKPSGSCNMHSWSQDPRWTAVCYNGDMNSARKMWSKPAELTNYKGEGFENAHWHSAKATVQSSLDGWKKSPGHNNLILNKDMWAKRTWKALGASVGQNYAVMWVGSEADPAKLT
eukprot:TRINITY_DN7588_c0_g1_i1.p1 TRINITY_DN7588_c0_g1~~TRINITY_DN7588_c0_g1_i1.p1  ORF type:complete len:192 (-),score=48.20 TRINITY_DN7588_c0_g1_i1:142-717(-)